MRDQSAPGPARVFPPADPNRRTFPGEAACVGGPGARARRRVGRRPGRPASTKGGSAQLPWRQQARAHRGKNGVCLPAQDEKPGGRNRHTLVLRYVKAESRSDRTQPAFQRTVAAHICLVSALTLSAAARTNEFILTRTGGGCCVATSLTPFFPVSATAVAFNGSCGREGIAVDISECGRTKVENNLL